jgi:hypothetical protein
VVALAEVGIAYAHERALGSPRELRNRLRENGDLAAFLLSSANTSPLKLISSNPWPTL